jgi:hypothetical protein
MRLNERDTRVLKEETLISFLFQIGLKQRAALLHKNEPVTKNELTIFLKGGIYCNAI